MINDSAPGQVLGVRFLRLPTTATEKKFNTLQRIAIHRLLVVLELLGQNEPILTDLVLGIFKKFETCN